MAIYLDNNATTPLHPQVKEAIADFLADYGNPGSMHEVGRRVKQRLEIARNDIAAFFKCTMDELVFTSCASEANNFVLKSVLFHEWGFRPHIITSNIEHPCIKQTCEFLKTKNIDITFLPVDKNGLLEPSLVEKAIKKETVLVTVMHANNEIGTIQPIEKIGEICQAKGVHFHSDMVQAPGKIPFDLSKLPVDTASFSAHKMYAPKGIGALYIKNRKSEKLPLTPLIHGGHQEEGLRAGTENTLGIVAFGAACKALSQELDDEIAHVTSLQKAFENAVIQRIPDIIINGVDAPRKPGTSNISFKYIEGEAILLRLDMQEICVSTGSACSTGSLDPSHVIMALYSEAEIAHGSIRFSFGRENSMEDVEKTVDALEETVSFLRSISPLMPKK